jgi:hypothetical protein
MNAHASNQYFQTWASAASSHDDERAIKRLQTQQRYVNLSEEKTAQKQQHCKCSREYISNVERMLICVRR